VFQELDLFLASVEKAERYLSRWVH